MTYKNVLTKSLLILILLFSTLNALFSQNKIKKNIKSETNFVSLEIIDITLKLNTYNYVISHKEEKYICKKYKNNMEFVSQKSFYFENKRILYIQKLGEKIVFVYTNDKIKKNQKSYIYGHFFDPKKMELSIGNTVLSEYIFKKKNGTDYFINTSQNNFLAVIINGYTNKKNTVFPKAKLFNKNLEEIWNKELKHTNYNISSTLRSLVIDKNGEVNAVISYLNKNEEIETYLEKIPLNKNTNNEKKINLNSIQSNISNATIEFGFNNEIIIAGKYNGPGIQIGTYIISIDKQTFEKKYNSKIIHSSKTLTKGKSKSFRKKFIQNYETGKKINYSSILFLADFGGVEDIIFKKDSGYYIINKNKRNLVWTDGVTGYSEIFKTGGVLITSVDKFGEIKWDQFVAIKQNISTPKSIKNTIRNEVFSDFNYSTFDNSLYFVYNDISKNISEDKELKEFKGKIFKSSLFLIKIHENGKINKAVIEDNELLKGMAIVKQGININKNETLFFLSETKNSTRRKIDRTITIKF